VPELAHGSAREIRRDVLEMVRPPQETTVAESAARALKIVNPSGASGNWSAATTPYMVEPMNLARSRLYEAVVFMGPARSGKTVALVDGVLAYSIVDDPADCMVVQTSQAAASDFSKMRIKRAVRGSPELASRISSRSHDDNDFLKVFRSGMAIRFGWPSVGQLSGKDLRRVLMTDVDNITGDLSIDEAFGLALKRTQTYMSAGICIAESSPARDYVDRKWRAQSPHEAPPADGIATLYNRGDRRLLYWPCPECKEPFAALPGMALFKLPEFAELRERMLTEDPLKMAERYSNVCCPACGVEIEARHKRWMVDRGRWVGQGQRIWTDGTVTGERLRTRFASFWLGGVAAAYQSWASLVERYLQAVKQFATTGETKALKSTINVDQAMPFSPPSAARQRGAHEFQQRCETWTPAHVPPGVRFLTAQVDVQAGQRRGFVIQVIGWGVNREHWVVDRYALKSSERVDVDGQRLPIDPSAYAEDWRRLIEKCIQRRYPLDDGSGRTMPVRLTVCDSGGEDGVTGRAYEFHRYLVTMRLAGRFRLVKGASSRNAPRVDQAYPDTRKTGRKSASRGDVPVLMLNTVELKDTVASDLARETPGAGYWHFPEWLPSSFYDELTAEERGAKGWAKIGGKNESVDLCAYGEAAYVWCGGDKINWQSPPLWAADWDVNPDVSADGAPAPVAIIQRRPASYLVK
jgi:phage terminase large subunit GpA-like protein